MQEQRLWFVCQAKTGDSQTAAALYWDAAVSSPDAWAALQGYLDCKVSREEPLANGSGHASKACAEPRVTGEQPTTLEAPEGISPESSSLGGAQNGHAATRSPAQVHWFSSPEWLVHGLQNDCSG